MNRATPGPELLDVRRTEASDDNLYRRFSHDFEPERDFGCRWERLNQEQAEPYREPLGLRAGRGAKRGGQRGRGVPDSSRGETFMLIVHADGGCQPNPGEGTIGVVAFKDGQCIHTHSEAIGQATNNIAEWSAALWALKYALDSGEPEIELRMDSRMVVMQLNGRWKVKHPGLKPYAVKAAELLKLARQANLKLTISWVGRDDNSAADQAAGAAQKHYVPMWAR